MKLYLVGGAVRDHLTGYSPGDYDFAVEAPSFEAMRDALKERGLEVWQERPEFVTLRGRMPLSSFTGTFGGMLPVLDPNPVGKKLKLYVAADWTLCRAEAMYHDNRHPSVVTPADLLTDLKRRDFTMNAMAMSEDGKLTDPHDGQRDLNARVLRTVGRPVSRFTEDPLRMLRALRFKVRLGMRLEPLITDAMLRPEIVELLTTLPNERITQELNKALVVNPSMLMQLLFLTFPHVGRVVTDMGVTFRALNHEPAGPR